MSNITFLRSFDEKPTTAGAVYRAGGTDLQERLRTSNRAPHIYDLTGISGFAGIERNSEGTVVMAGTSIAEVARELRDDYPALAISSASLATPQIRSVGTIGGNLAQRTRCWYFRHPDIECLKSGGDRCPARDGRHLYGVVFDNSECVHPHPSTMGMALLAYDANVTLAGGEIISVEDLFGDGRDPTRDNLLPAGEIIASILLPPPWEDEKGAYFRSISRYEAEWPLVEAVVRLSFGPDGSVSDCGIGLGGVASVPLRITAAEELLRGSRLDDPTITAVARACTEGANPLPETGYKVPLIEATVRGVLDDLAEHV